MLKFDARFVEFTFNEAVAMLLADGLRLHLFKDSSDFDKTSLLFYYV